MLSSDVLALPDFASEDEVAALSGIYDAAVRADGRCAPVHVPPGGSIVLCRNARRVCSPETLDHLLAVRQRVLSTIRHEFFSETFPELTVLTEMRLGDHHAIHADAERETPSGWEPNHCAWRTHVGILYLNTCGADFEGGALRFPGIDRKIAPTRGLLIAFPSGRRHAHEVTDITAGHRRTLTIWLTEDPTHAEPFGAN